MGSHTVYYLPPDTSERAPTLTPASKLVLDLPIFRGTEVLSWPRLPDNKLTGSRTRDLSITRPTPQPLHHRATTVIADLQLSVLSEKEVWKSVSIFDEVVRQKRGGLLFGLLFILASTYFTYIL